MSTSPLYAIADTQLLGPRLLEASEAALAGGCSWIQYRDKTDHVQRRQTEARALLALCRQYNARLLINDAVELAHDIGADGVHLGQGDGDTSEARALLGEHALIGVTCHDSLNLAVEAQQAGASYVAFGRFFPSRTKPEAPPAPIELLRQARGRLGYLPLVAIGGVSVSNAPELLEAGANRLAVSHDLFCAPDITHRARTFAQLSS